MGAPAPASEESYQTRIALLLAAAAVVIAIVGARSSGFAGSASGSWEKAVRVQVKQSAMRTENELFAYGDPVTTAVQYETARVRAQEYRRELRRHDLTRAQRQALVTLAAVEESVSADRLAAVARQGAAPLRAYGAGFDLARMLADEQRKGRAALESARVVGSGGDAHSTRAVAGALAVLPAALAFLLGSLARARPRRARPLLLAGAVTLAVALAGAIAVEAVPL